MTIYICTGSLSYVYAHSYSLKEDILRIEQKLHVEIIINEVISGTWETVTYEVSTDTTALRDYLSILEDEYTKYPQWYISKIGIRTIVIGEKLQLLDQERAAIPDPYKGILFLSLSFRENSETYQIHVMHHELHHCAEYYYWKTMNYDWNSWNVINAPSFVYQGTGASAYENTDIDWYTMTRPSEGFINLYSTTASEEDRAELVAIIMTDQEKQFLEEHLMQDLILQQKVLLIKILLTEISGESDGYWNTVFD